MMAWIGRIARLTCCGILLLASAGCGGGSDAPPPQATEDVLFAESVAVPIKIRKSADGRETTSGGVVTVKIVNTLNSHVTITELVPESDPGLKATYLGYTTCRSPCVGAGEWSAEDQKHVNSSKEGTLPIQLSPDSHDVKAIRLIFRLEVVAPSGFSDLRSICRLRLRTVRATFSSGKSFRIGTGGAGAIAGLVLPQPTEKCPTVDGNPLD